MIRLATNDEILLLNNLINYKISDNEFEKCYVYIIDDIIIGLIDFSDIYNRLELNYIWIDNKYRGKNYSKDLMDYMIEYATRKKQIDNITLEVSENNEIAINLYKKYDFKKVAMRKNYYNGIDGILMIRKFDIYE